MNKLKFQLLFYYYRLLHPNVKVSAQLPLAQAVVESANFTSHVFAETNNCMGMGIPAVRETLAINKGGTGFARFDSAADCVADYLLFLDQMGLHTDQKLLEYFPKYAKDPKYKDKVLAMSAQLNKNGEYINPTVVVAGGAVGAAALIAGAVYTFSELV